MATGGTGTWEPVLYLVGPTGSIGPTGTFSFSGVTGAILYSPDGVGVTGSGKLVYKEELVSITPPIPGIIRGITYDSVGGYVALRITSTDPPYESFIMSSSNGESWVGVTGPIGGILTGTTYGSAGGYVAVGGDGTNTLYLTSSNGVSWTSGTGPIQGLLYAVTYGDTDGYVAVGYDSNTSDSIYLTSSNGVSWTGGIGPIQGELHSITYDSAGGYVAVGKDSNALPNSMYLTSSNGQSWTGGTGPIQGELFGITYDVAGGYVAVGCDSQDPKNTMYITSSNGVSWTGGTGPIQGELCAITYDVAGGYVAVGGKTINGGTDSLFLTSADGVSWTGGTGPVPGILFGIAYGSTGGYVAVGTKAGNAGYDALYLTSSDGQGWTGGGITAGSVEIPKSSITIDALIDNSGSTGAPGQLLTAGPTGSGLVWTDPPPNPLETFSGVTGSILYSPDGVGVTGSAKEFYGESMVLTTAPIIGSLLAVTYASAGGTIAVGFSGNDSLYLLHPTADTWTSGTGPIQGVLQGITYGSAGGYVAVGESGANMIYLTSSNGESWTGGTGPIPGYLTGITYGSTGGYVAVGYDTSSPPNSIYLTSPDGLSWTGGTGPIPGYLSGVTYGSAGGYVAVGFDNSSPVNSLYLTSSDGLSWTGGTAPIPGSLNGITYDAAGGYVAVGFDNSSPPNSIYLTSPDGVSWTGGIGPIQGELLGITYGSTGGYVAVGYDFGDPPNSIYLTSSDGETWTGGTGPIPGTLRGITYTPLDGYLAVGYVYDGSYNNTTFMRSSVGLSWTGSAELINETILKSTITPDILVDNLGSTGAPGQVLTARPTGAGLVWADPTITIEGTAGSILYSPDGVGVTGSAKAVFQEVFNNVPVLFTGYNVQAITNGAQGPIAVGVAGSETLYIRHPDAATWIGGTGPIQGALYGIAYGPTGGYVAVGFDNSSPPNSIYLTSPDGVSWTGGTGPIPGSLNGITYDSAGGYVAVGYTEINDQNDSLILRSVDGQSWTADTGPIQATLQAITYGSTGGYVAVGYDFLSPNNSIYLTSSDGLSWTGGTGPIPGYLNGITYDAAGGYVAVGNTVVNNDSVPLYLLSSDGETWTGGTGPFLGELKDVTYNPAGGYVAVGYYTDTTIYLTSPDGVTWTGGTGSILGFLEALTYTSNDGYLAVGTSSSENQMMSMTSSNGDVWTSSVEMGTTGIYHTSITIDTLVDSLGSTGAAGQVLTAGPTGGSLLWSLPTTPMGKMIRVDSVYGDDLLGSPGNHPYQTVNAAIDVASNAGPGYTIWVMPGTYNLSNSITIPTGCALRGSSTQTTIIQMCNVLFDTTLVTMGENTRVEDLTLIIHSTGNIPLTGIEFPGTTSVTGKLRSCVLTVNNSNATIQGVDTDVIGIKSSGTGTLGTASFSFNSLKGSTVNIYSNGGGNKRGILISAANTMTTRDMNIYVAAPADSNSAGSYIGIETTNSDGKIQCRSTTISGYSSDIKQTQGSIELGPGVDIVNKTAGGCNFTSYVYPTILYYGVKGFLANSGLTTGYLWPGTAASDSGGGGRAQYPDSNVAYYRAQQKSVITGMYATLASNAGSNHSAIITLQVNGSNTSFSLTFSNDTSNPACNSYYDSSITLQQFDRISVKLELDTVGSNGGVFSNTSHDLSLQVDIF